jgi:hypothetical protein
MILKARECHDRRFTRTTEYQLQMTSRQINFYVLPEEQLWFENIIRTAGPFLILCRIIKEGEPVLLQSTVVERFGDEDLTAYLIRRADLDKLVVTGAPKQTELFVDDLRSPVLQYSRCYFDGERVRRGRLYFVESYFDNHDKRVEKPDDFIKWGRNVLALVRKCLNRRDDGDYASIGAVQRERAGSIRLIAE